MKIRVRRGQRPLLQLFVQIEPLKIHHKPSFRNDPHHLGQSVQQRKAMEKHDTQNRLEHDSQQFHVDAIERLNEKQVDRYAIFFFF